MHSLYREYAVKVCVAVGGSFILAMLIFQVVVTEEKGRGVIATRTFSPGEFVVEYIGELISGSEARAREAEYNKDPSVGSFMFFFSYGYSASSFIPLELHYLNCQASYQSTRISV